MIIVIISGFVVALVLAWLWFGDRLAPGEPTTDLDRAAERLASWFDEWEESGIAIDEPVVWNYLFVDRDYARLRSFGDRLAKDGYTVVEMQEIDDGSTGVVDFELRVQRTERHTPSSLARRNIELRELSQAAGIDLYDRWYPAPIHATDVADPFPEGLQVGATVAKAAEGRLPEATESQFSNLPLAIEEPLFVYVKIPGPIEPMERGERFEDPLEDRLRAEDAGTITGGGSMLSAPDANGTRKIEYCGIDVDLLAPRRGLALLVNNLRKLGAPAGTTLQFTFESRAYELDVYEQQH